MRLRDVSYTAQCVCVVSARCPSCLCVSFFADGALREVSPRQRLPARPVTTSHRVHTGLEVGEVVDKFEQTLRTQRVCSHSCVTVLVLRTVRV